MRSKIVLMTGGTETLDFFFTTNAKYIRSGRI